MRTIFGYAVLAIIGFVAIKVAFGLLGVALTIAFNLLWLAAIGFGFYLVLKLISPGTAQRVREAVTGQRAA